MKLVIEREGGFDIIESSEAVTRIEVKSDAVEVWYLDSDGEESVRRVQMSSHAESAATAAAIAAKCGALVEALAKGPAVVTETVMSDPSEVLVPPRNPGWDGEAAMSAASAALVRKNSKPWKSASEWVEGEPPRDGSTYVAREGGNSLCVRWDGKRWMAGGLPVVFGSGVEHRALGDGVAEGAGVSQWVDGEPPRDGRWYVGMWANPLMRVVRWDEGNQWWRGTSGGEWGLPAPASHWPTPIPER